MKRILISFATLFYFVSCSNINETTNSQNDTSTDTSKNTGELTEMDTANTENDDFELFYVVSVATGNNYDSLRKIAIMTSELLNFQFDTMGRYYNRIKGKIVLLDNDEDEVWAGEYFFRRSDENFVSVEMQTAYIDTLTSKDEKASIQFHSDTLKMFVFATMYQNKIQAESLLKKIKPKFKNATIIPTEIYMGCIH